MGTFRVWCSRIWSGLRSFIRADLQAGGAGFSEHSCRPEDPENQGLTSESSNRDVIKDGRTFKAEKARVAIQKRVAKCGAHEILAVDAERNSGTPD